MKTRQEVVGVEEEGEEKEEVRSDMEIGGKNQMPMSRSEILLFLAYFICMRSIMNADQRQ